MVAATTKSRIRFRALIAAVASLLIAMLAANPLLAEDLDQEVTFSIPAQRLETALLKFSQQAGVQLLTSSNEIPETLSPGVSGRLRVRAALKTLLEGTGLTFSQISAGTVAITEKGEKNTADTSRQSLVRVARVGDASSSISGQASGEQESARPAQTAASDKLDEIIVTATKRAERLQDVPISISVLTAEDIDRRGLVHAADYLRGIPGANQTESVYAQTITIRGMETLPHLQNFSSGPTTATFFGETPTTHTAGSYGGNADIKLVDIERVEVLKGPQGTAFGSSSMGGAVRQIPVAPKLDRFEGKVASGYSVTSGSGGRNYDFQAVGNIPLIADKLAIRAVAYAFSDSGFYRNRAGSDPAFQAFAARYGSQAFATDEDEVGAYYSTGARIAALFQASERLRFTLNYLTQKNELDGFPVQNNLTAYEQTVLRIPPEHVRRGQTAGYNDTKMDIANAVMEYGFGWADLLATYSYLDSRPKSAVTWTTDNSLWSFGPISPRALEQNHSNIGEVRLVTRFDGAWNFLAGLYAEKQFTERFLNYIWNGDPATNFFRPGDRIHDTYDRHDVTQKAAFGEVSWQFAPHFTLTGGVRTYQFDRTYRNEATGFLGNIAPRRSDADASGSTFRGNLSWKPADNTLLYAGWSQGFRLGRPQPQLAAGTCDTNGDGIIDGTSITLASTGSVSSDSVDSYEIGGKFAVLDRRLTVDAAVFRMEWSDIPVTVWPNVAGGCIAGYLTNAGAATSEGAELQASFRATPSLQIDIGGSYLDARLSKDVPAQGFLAGDRLPAAPKVNANLGLQQDFDLGGHPAFVRADAIYVGTFYGDVRGPRLAPDIDAGGYVKLDASARVSIEHLNIDLFVRNLTNEDDFTARRYGLSPVEFGYRLRPRTIGLQLSYSF